MKSPTVETKEAYLEFVNDYKRVINFDTAAQQGKDKTHDGAKVDRQSWADVRREIRELHDKHQDLWKSLGVVHYDPRFYLARQSLVTFLISVRRKFKQLSAEARAVHIAHLQTA